MCASEGLRFLKSWGTTACIGVVFATSLCRAQSFEGLNQWQIEAYQRVVAELNRRAAHPGSAVGVPRSRDFDERDLRALADSDDPQIRETLARFIAADDVENTRRSIDYIFDTALSFGGRKTTRFLNEAAQHHPVIRQAMEAILFSEHPQPSDGVGRILSNLRQTVYNAYLAELSAQPQPIQDRLLHLTGEFHSYDSYFTALEGLPDGLQRLIALSGGSGGSHRTMTVQNRLIRHMPELPADLRQSLMERIINEVPVSRQRSTGWGGHSSWHGPDPDLDAAVDALFTRGDLPLSITGPLLGARYSGFAAYATNYLRDHPSPEARDLLLRFRAEHPESHIAQVRSALMPYGGQTGVDAALFDSLRRAFDERLFYAMAERRSDPAVREGLISLITAGRRPMFDREHMAVLEDLITDPRVRRWLVTQGWRALLLF